MKASVLIEELQLLIDNCGDKDVVIVGVFDRGVMYSDFDLYTSSDYNQIKPDTFAIPTENVFLIDKG